MCSGDGRAFVGVTKAVSIAAYALYPGFTIRNAVNIFLLIPYVFDSPIANMRLAYILRSTQAFSAIAIVLTYALVTDNTLINTTT